MTKAEISRSLLQTSGSPGSIVTKSRNVSEAERLQLEVATCPNPLFGDGWEMSPRSAEVNPACGEHLPGCALTRLCEAER